MFVRSASAAESQARDTKTVKKDKKGKTTFMMNVSGDSACFCVDRRGGGGAGIWRHTEDDTCTHKGPAETHMLSVPVSLVRPNKCIRKDGHQLFNPARLEKCVLCVCAHTKGGSNKSLKVSPIWKVSWAKR